MGTFNGMSNAMNTSFMKTMKDQVQQAREKKGDALLQSIDFEHNEPPELKELEGHPGLVVGLSMFAKYDEWRWRQRVSDYSRMRMQGKGQNMRLVDARRYIPWVGECGARTANTSLASLSVCAEPTDPDGDKAAEMHRCAGPGHPDAVVWELLTVINEWADGSAAEQEPGTTNRPRLLSAAANSHTSEGEPAACESEVGNYWWVIFIPLLLCGAKYRLSGPRLKATKALPLDHEGGACGPEP